MASEETPTFRTVQSPLRNCPPIGRDEPLAFVGSCFSDSVGALLARDGFDVSVNAMGALYNPMSMARVLARALEVRPYTAEDLVRDDSGVWHCLDFESRRQNSDVAALLETLNADFLAFSNALRRAKVWVVTFGTAWVFRLRQNGHIVGNCHKFPAAAFERYRVTPDEIVRAWEPLCRGRRIIFTVSPIRHLADGLHGNTLSKAVLHLAVDSLCGSFPDNVLYFPSFEILMDDLRDYRFYADDMKHPSDVAVAYIYDIFSRTFFTAQTRRLAAEYERQARRLAHRPILPDR